MANHFRSSGHLLVLADDLIKAVVDACLAAAGLHAKPDTANGARNGKHQHGSEKAAGAKADKEDTGTMHAPSLERETFKISIESPSYCCVAC